MPEIDVALLKEATRYVFGFTLHRWFNNYLTFLVDARNRLAGRGLTSGRPTFDFQGIDIHQITNVVGTYFFVMARHKTATAYWLRPTERKRILYLRGFEFENAAAVGGGLGMGNTSMDTQQFNRMLVETVQQEFDMYAAWSPRDLFYETIGPDIYFYGDFGKLIRSANRPIRAFYLHAHHWKSDIEHLVDRCDHVVVYVSSITESILWELDLLRRKHRTPHTTIVFDQQAVLSKEHHTRIADWMQAYFGDQVTWEKRQSESPSQCLERVREVLEMDVIVTTPETFKADYGRHRARISKSIGPLVPGKRENPLPFRFAPALDAGKMDVLETLEGELEAELFDQLHNQRIVSVPVFVNHLQFWLFTSLLLGQRLNAGRALAMYAAVLDVANDVLFAREATDAEAATDLSEEQQAAAATLGRHAQYGEDAALALLGAGETHEFGDYTAQANVAYQQSYVQAAHAARNHYAEAQS